MCWILEVAEKLGGLASVATALASVVTAVVAGIALVIAYRQVVAVRESQREATAKDIYRDYLKLAFDNPKFANPVEFISEAGGGWKHKGEWNNDERYRWFGAFMLNSCDEIIRSKPGDNVWRKVILMDLKMHKDYLNSPEFVEDGGWCLYSCELKHIGEEAVK